MQTLQPNFMKNSHLLGQTWEKNWKKTSTFARHCFQQWEKVSYIFSCCISSMGSYPFSQLSLGTDVIFLQLPEASPGRQLAKLCLPPSLPLMVQNWLSSEDLFAQQIPETAQFHNPTAYVMLMAQESLPGRGLAFRTC